MPAGRRRYSPFRIRQDVADSIAHPSVPRRSFVRRASGKKGQCEMNVVGIVDSEWHRSRVDGVSVEAFSFCHVCEDKLGSLHNSSGRDKDFE